MLGTVIGDTTGSSIDEEIGERYIAARESVKPASRARSGNGNERVKPGYPGHASDRSMLPVEDGGFDPVRERKRIYSEQGLTLWNSGVKKVPEVRYQPMGASEY